MKHLKTWFRKKVEITKTEDLTNLMKQHAIKASCQLSEIAADVYVPGAHVFVAGALIHINKSVKDS